MYIHGTKDIKNTLPENEILIGGGRHAGKIYTQKALMSSKMSQLGLQGDPTSPF